MAYERGKLIVGDAGSGAYVLFATNVSNNGKNVGYQESHSCGLQDLARSLRMYLDGKVSNAPEINYRVDDIQNGVLSCDSEGQHYLACFPPIHETLYTALMEHLDERVLLS